MGILNLDLVIFGSLVFVYNRIKQIKPELFFLAKGTAVFLPPDEKDVKDMRKEQEKLSKKGGKKPLMPVKMIKATHDFFSQHKFSVELDIVIMLLVCLGCQLVISYLLRVFVLSKFDQKDKEINFGFALGLSILLLIIAYFCKAAKIAGWKSADTKTSFWVAVLSSVLMLTLFLGFKEFIDFDFQKAVEEQQKHLEFVLSPQEKKKGVSFSIEIFQLGCIFLNGIVTFSTIPTIMRFCNCYTQNLSRTVELSQKEEERVEEEEILKKKKEENPFLIADREENLEVSVQNQSNLTLGNHKKNMLLFNISLVINLITVVLWIKPVANIIISKFGSEGETYLPLLRIILVVIQCVIQLLTLRYQVQMFMQKSFDYIKSLTSDNSEIAYAAVKQKTSAYLQSCIYVTFQIFVSTIIPLLLAVLIIYRIYLSPSNPIPNADTLNVPLADTIQDQVPSTHQDSSSSFFFLPEEQTAIIKQIYSNIKNYSLFNNTFVDATLSFWLFNYQLIAYMLKIIFIIISRQSQGI